MKTSPRNGPRGFTLLELVVVLAVLAILTGMAVASFTAVEDQARFDTTARQLEEIEIAVLGERNLRDPNNKQLVNGFVADIGRLPLLSDHDSNTSTYFQPAELWLPPAVVAPFALRPATHNSNPALSNITSVQNITTGIPESPGSTHQDAAVILPCGWRGPYLRLSTGTSLLRDGWGNPLIPYQADGTTLSAAGQTVARLRTLGSDNAVGGATNEELDRDLITQDLSQNRSLGSLSVTLGTGVTADEVRVYSPDPDTGKIRVFKITLAPYVFNNLPIGPKVVRAYQTGTPASRSYSVSIPFGGLASFPLEN